MAKGKGKGRGKGKGKGSKAKSKSKHIPLDILQNRLGKLSTIVAKRGGKLPKTFH